jgi:hypothetical protein
LTLLSDLQKSLGCTLCGHFTYGVGRLLLLYGSLVEAALKVCETRFQLLYAPTLPMHRLEKAVECFPDILLAHDPCPSSFTGCFNLLFHT